MNLWETTGKMVAAFTLVGGIMGTGMNAVCQNLFDVPSHDVDMVRAGRSGLECAGGGALLALASAGAAVVLKRTIQ